MDLPEDLTKFIATKHDIRMLEERLIKLETLYKIVNTIEAIWGRLEKIEQIQTIQGEQLGRLEERMDRLEERMDRLEERMDRLEEQTNKLEKQMGELNTLLKQLTKNMQLIMLFLRIPPQNGGSQN